MCDDGRFGWKYIHSAERLITPRIGRGAAALQTAGAHAGNGDVASQQIAQPDLNDLVFDDPWAKILDEIRQTYRQISGSHSKRLLGVFSPFMTCEEAYLLAKFLRGIDKHALLTMGPIPVVGEDDLYPKNFRGEAPEPSKARFTIRAEKCPNRLGVMAVLRAFESKATRYDQVADRIQKGEFSGAFIVGGNPDGWSDTAF